jgi:GAF domain-containing protein
MLKGIAHAGSGDSSEDRYGIVLALSQLTHTLASVEGPSAFYAAAETAATLLHASQAVVFLRDESGRLTAGGIVGENDEQLIAAARDIAEEALSLNVPLLIPNVSADPHPYARKVEKSGLTSLLCVAMRVGDTNVGAIVVMSTDLRAFSPGDIELLHVVASHAALAVLRSRNTTDIETTRQEQDELIRLADRKIQELSLLNRISEAMSSTLDLDALLKIALEESLTAVGAGAGSIMLVSEETGRLEIVASRGLDRKWVETTSQEIGKSIAGWVAKHGESVLVTDARKDSRFAMPFYRDNITSSASVPLKTKEGVIGVLNVNTVQPGKTFDERDLELLVTVANQMAVAIENARLYARVNRRTKQLSSLLQISRTITATLNLDEVLYRLTTEMCALFQLDACAVLLVDEVSGRLRLGYGTGLKTRRKYAYYDIAAPLAARVKRTGRKLVVRDVSSSSSSYTTEVSKAEGLKAAVALPLKNHGRLVGIAVGFAKEARRFTKSQNAIMKPLGDLAGVAIHNARVYRRKYRIADMLQHRLLPTEIPQIEGLDIGCKFLPAREVGGDYYDFIPLGSNRIGLVVSDVVGSDIEAAEYTTMGKHVLRVYARECVSPAEVLTKTNNLICEDTSAEVFISSFYGVVDLDKMVLRYANAGCEPAALYKAKDQKVLTLLADGILLGIRGGSIYEEREVPLESGDILAVYTDGLTEASVGNQRFGAAAVAQILAAYSHLTAQGIADRLHDALLEFVHGRVTDDVAMLVVKVC